MKKTLVFLTFLLLGIAFIILLNLFARTYLQSPFSEPCLSLTFDDGHKSDYSIVYPLLKKKQYNATFFLTIDHYKKKANSVYMTQSEAQTLAESGYEIGSHTMTHPNLKKLDAQRLAKELADSKTMLETDFDTRISSLALPYFKYNKAVLEISKMYYGLIRSAYPKSFYIKTYTPVTHTSSQIVCGLAEQAKAKNLWLILVFHAIEDSPEFWSITEEKFAKILDCIEETGIPVHSFQGCKTRLFKS